MADGTIGVKQSASPDKQIDNGEYTVSATTVERQRIEQMEYAPATANITAVDTGHAAITAGTISSTSPAANSSTSLTFLSATGVVGVLVTGTWVATLQFEVSVDGTNWTTCNAVVPGSGALASSTTANGIWRIPTGGFATVRVRCTAFTSGTATVAFRSGMGTAQVELGEALPTGSNVVGGVTQSGTWTVQPGNTANTTAWKVDGSAVTQPVGGVAASGASVSGNPVLQGGRGSTANPTAVTDGQAVAALFDKLGKQVVVGAVRDLKGQQQTTITSSTSETTIATAVASTFLDLYGLILTNTSATGTKVTIKDSTSGTTRAVIWVPANDTRGFMLDPSAGLNQATVNTNWTATCGTSVASLEATAIFVKNL